MFDILMYLFESFMHSESDIYVDQDQLTDELVRAGFHHDEIFKALAWLEKLTALQESEEHPYLNRVSAPDSMRVFTFMEEQILDVECRGFLMFLEQIKVLDLTTREMVVDRVMEIESNEFCLEDLKWVVLMVLFNVPGKESAYAQMEELLFEQPDGVIH